MTCLDYQATWMQRLASDDVCNVERVGCAGDLQCNAGAFFLSDELLTERRLGRNDHNLFAVMDDLSAACARSNKVIGFFTFAVELDEGADIDRVIRFEI